MTWMVTPYDMDGDTLSAYMKGDELWLRSQQHGVKRVADFSSHRHPMLWLENSKHLIEGFYLSPVEERIVIVVTILLRAFEGD